MVRTCCIKSCRESYSSDTNVSFHQFPKNPDLRKQWIERTNIEFFATAQVCSKHFSDDCFKQSGWSSRLALKCDALPTLLIAEPNYEQNATSAVTENIEPGTSSIRKRKVYLGDFTNSDIEDDKENYVNIVNATIKKKNRVIKTLLDKTKRLEKRVTDLQTLVDKLQNNAMITKEASIHLSESLPLAPKHSLNSC
ncbi:THAP domain-containing protein 2-like [Lasioglossum baleicum]|uniref:THAP domain-containing protein 2-like n=1 Tax=Lasioglossum baleicum TaxID=434251 RepID=UPI003FCE2332